MRRQRRFRRRSDTQGMIPNQKVCEFQFLL
ncbi:unnamed protein product [Anisakis simplex]|uniref:Ribosomal protein S18 n=1 Tax=Anisakis simplex TaxID=6269 RepID=A0A0M3JPZ5_ANISI|nr:unnamed protein product [Anisakis simplex]